MRARSRPRRNLENVAHTQFCKKPNEPAAFFVGRFVDGAETLHLVRVFAARDGESHRRLLRQEDVPLAPCTFLETEGEEVRVFAAHGLVAVDGANAQARRGRVVFALELLRHEGREHVSQMIAGLAEGGEKAQAGVAIAIGQGGPGAVVWLIVAGFLGMSSKFAECTLGQMYRHVDSDGVVTGGPMRYLSQGLAELGWKRTGTVLAAMFAVMCMGGAVGGGGAFQVGQSRDAIREQIGFFDRYPWVYGLLIAALTGVVIIGGIRRIAATADLYHRLECRQRDRRIRRVDDVTGSALENRMVLILAVLGGTGIST